MSELEEEMKSLTGRIEVTGESDVLQRGMVDQKKFYPTVYILYYFIYREREMPVKHMRLSVLSIGQTVLTSVGLTDLCCSGLGFILTRSKRQKQKQSYDL